MIVVPDGDALTVFAQEAHAHLAGELAAWLPPREWASSALVAAARVHDNGWREADLEPTVDETGRPHTFYRVPPDVYTAVWRRGIARAAGVDPLVGLLVGLHGARFFGLNPHEEVLALHDEERQRENRVLAELGLGGSWQALPSAVQSVSDWIAFLDQLSLMVCGALADVAEREVDGVGYRAVRSGGLLTLAPWPFAVAGGPVSIAGRRLPQALHPSAGALRDALTDAPAITATSIVQPARD
jgi:hypothetical protein